MSALGNFFGKDLSSEFTNVNITGDEAGNDQETMTDFQEAKYTFSVDYTKPFSEKITLETGAQYVLNNVSNDFAVSDLINGELVPNVNLTNIFEYNQDVLGVYGTGAYEGEKWGLKLGLRIENTDLRTLLVNTDERNNQNFTNFFPSAATSYKVSSRFSLQGSYIFEKVSFNFGVYYRYTTDVVERISTFQDNVTTFQPENIGTKKSTGVELNGKYTPAKWLTFNGDVNYVYFKREGTLEGTSFDFDADQWSSKLTAKFKLPADIDFEMTGQYQSEQETVQGKIADNLFMDLGLRKKILKGKMIVNISVRDVFASRIRESEIFQEDFYTFARSLRGRFFTFGISYGFGKGEAMEFSGRRRR